MDENGFKTMDEMGKKLKQLAFNQTLFLEMIEKEKYPFFEMVIKKGLLEEELTTIYTLCEALTNEYEEQIEMGFVYFFSLYDTFAQSLNRKLDPVVTIHAMHAQNLYKPLMTRLKLVINNKG
jgi:hypothetical protein